MKLIICIIVFFNNFCQANIISAKFRNAEFDINSFPLEKIPCQSLLLKVIQSFSADDVYLSRLISAMTNLGQHQFYEVADEQRDKKALAKIISEFNEMALQPKDQPLSVYAVTDKTNLKTYLLPSFNQLSESEQATVLWGEGFWILDPYTRYEKVVQSKIAFENYLSAKAKDQIDLALPRIVGELIGDSTFSIKAAHAFEKRYDLDKTISIKELFVDLEKYCKAREIKREFGVLFYNVYCLLDHNMVSSYLKAAPLNSLFHQEIIHYLASSPNSKILFSQTYPLPLDELNLRPTNIPITALSSFGKIRFDPQLIDFHEHHPR